MVKLPVGCQVTRASKFGVFKTLSERSLFLTLPSFIPIMEHSTRTAARVMTARRSRPPPPPQSPSPLATLANAAAAATPSQLADLDPFLDPVAANSFVPLTPRPPGWAGDVAALPPAAPEPMATVAAAAAAPPSEAANPVPVPAAKKSRMRTPSAGAVPISHVAPEKWRGGKRKAVGDDAAAVVPDSEANGNGAAADRPLSNLPRPRGPLGSGVGAGKKHGQHEISYVADPHRRRNVVYKRGDTLLRKAEELADMTHISVICGYHTPSGMLMFGSSEFAALSDYPNFQELLLALTRGEQLVSLSFKTKKKARAEGEPAEAADDDDAETDSEGSASY